MARKADTNELPSNGGPPRDGADETRRSPGAANKALIARNLRLAYGEVAAEPLPKAWLDMLSKLDETKSEES